MLKNLKSKKGNEILQTLVVIAIIGALTITICVLVSNKFKKTTQTSQAIVGNSLTNTIKEFNYTSSSSQTLINSAGN